MGAPARHPVGWLLLALGLSLNASGVAVAYASYGLLARPGALPAARSVAPYLPATIVLALDQPDQGPRSPLDLRGLGGAPLASHQLAFGVTNLVLLGLGTTRPAPIEAFGARLRRHVDLDTLTGELLAVVEQTIEPTTAWLWLRPSTQPPDGRPTVDARPRGIDA